MFGDQFFRGRNKVLSIPLSNGYHMYFGDFWSCWILELFTIWLSWIAAGTEAAAPDESEVGKVKTLEPLAIEFVQIDAANQNFIISWIDYVHIINLRSRNKNQCVSRKKSKKN